MLACVLQHQMISFINNILLMFRNQCQIEGSLLPYVGDLNSATYNLFFLDVHAKYEAQQTLLSQFISCRSIFSYLFSTVLFYMACHLVRIPHTVSYSPFMSSFLLRCHLFCPIPLSCTPLSYIPLFYIPLSYIPLSYILILLSSRLLHFFSWHVLYLLIMSTLLSPIFFYLVLFPNVLCSPVMYFFFCIMPNPLVSCHVLSSFHITYFLSVLFSRK